MKTETHLNMHAEAHIHIHLGAHTQHTHVMYALLKHIHRACWDLPVTNNRGVKCEVCICHVSVLSACEVAVNEESRWRADIARRSRQTLPKAACP